LRTDEAGNTGEYCKTIGLCKTAVLGKTDAVCLLNEKEKNFISQKNFISEALVCRNRQVFYY